MPAPTSALQRKVNQMENPSVCGFCSTGKHDRCVLAIAKAIKGATWVCPCSTCGGGTSRTRCMRCKNEQATDIGSDRYCIDKDACEARVQSKLAANPLIQQITRIKENIMTAQAEGKTTSTGSVKAKVAKVGKCLVTGEPTKGGKFKPGMDAKYVSLRVAEVMEGKVKESDARNRLVKETESEPLLNKFNRSLALAKEKKVKADLAAKEAEAKKAEAAKAKADEKAAKAAAKQAEKDAEAATEPEAVEVA